MTKLPNGYQEVEYIGCTGTQYINPGVSIESNIQLGIEVDFLYSGNSYNQLYSIYDNGSRFQNGIWYSNHMFENNCTGTDYTYTWTPNSVATNTRYTLEASGVPSWNNATGCYLLAQQENNSANSFMVCDLYYAKLYKNNQLVRDFVPCYRISDTEIGLYDLVNDVFYTNAGSGSFTKGPDVNPIKYIDRYYLNGEEYGIKFGGGGWQPGANTLAYYDFETDTSSLINKASSGSIYDGTYYSTPTFGTTANGKRYFNCGGNNYATTPVIPFSFSNTTIVMWMYFDSYTNGFLFGTGWYSSLTLGIAIQGINNNLSLGINKNGVTDEYLYSPYPSGWHLVTCVIDGTSPKWYIDKTLVYTGSLTTSGNNPYNVGIGTLYEQKHQYTRSFIGYYGSVIIENAQWIKQEIDDYFDQTKSLYGIS